MFGRKSRRRLLRENEAMRQALAWYATQETWLHKGIHQKGAPRKKWKKSPAAFDRGHLAIRVLTQLDEPNAVTFTGALPVGTEAVKSTVPPPLATSEPTNTTE